MISTLERGTTERPTTSHAFSAIRINKFCTFALPVMYAQQLYHKICRLYDYSYSFCLIMLVSRAYQFPTPSFP